MWFQSYCFVETATEHIRSKFIEISSNSEVKDVYAYRFTKNKWTTFIMATQDNIGEFLDY